MIDKNDNVYVNLITSTSSLEEILEYFKYQPINQRTFQELILSIKPFMNKDFYVLFTRIDHKINIGYDNYDDYKQEINSNMSPEEYFLLIHGYNRVQTMFMLERVKHGN